MIRYLKTAFHTFTDYCLTYDIKLNKHHGWMDNQISDFAELTENTSCANGRYLTQE